MADIEVALEAPITETPAADAPRSMAGKRASWTQEQRDHWQLTGEEPGTKSDAIAESSTATPETPSKEGAVETEPEPGPGETREQKSSRQSWKELREAKKKEEEARLKAEARAELLEKQLAESRKSPPAASTEERKPDPAKPPLTAKPIRPKLSDPKFKTIDEYETAMEAYETEKERWDDQQVESRLQKERQSQSEQQLERTRTQQVADMKKIHSDYEAVAFNKAVPASDVMLSVLDALPDGPELRYALGKNLAEATRIAELTHIEGLAELWKTNPARAGYLWGVAEATAKAELAKLVKVKSAPPKEKTPAAKPSGELSVTGKGSTSETLDDDQLLAQKKITFGEWKRRKNAKDAESFRAGQ